MRRNDEVQAAIIAYLKANATILAELVDIHGDPVPEEIREDQWQGENFSYPNIRVRLISNVPLLDEQCDFSTLTVSIMVFSEEASSQEADRIAGIIHGIMHQRSFEQNSIAFTLRTTNLIPAVRQDIRVWRSEVLMSGIVT